MINHLSTVGILGNVILTAFKLLAGIIGHSGAMISDAVHSLSDVFATFIAFLGVKLSKKSADSEHPYGHDRLECVASMVLAAILLATGIGIGMSGVKTIIAGDYSHLQAPGTIALVAAIVSILTKEGMFWYTRHYAKILDSAAFMADAWHHRSDAFSSVGSRIVFIITVAVRGKVGAVRGGISVFRSDMGFINVKIFYAVKDGFTVAVISNSADYIDLRICKP